MIFNDILTVLERAFADGHDHCMLACLPTTAADGRFRKFDVRVSGSRGLVNAKCVYWPTARQWCHQTGPVATYRPMPEWCRDRRLRGSRRRGCRPYWRRPAADVLSRRQEVLLRPSGM